MRRAARVTMVVLGAVLLALAAIAWYADDTIVDGREFATRLPSSLDDAGVRRVVADQIVTGLTNSAVPDALVVRPLIVPLVAVVADTPVFRRAVRGAGGRCGGGGCGGGWCLATVRSSGATRRSACGCRSATAPSSRGSGGSLRA